MKETLRAVLQSIATHLTFEQRLAVGLEYRLQMNKIRFRRGDIDMIAVAAYMARQNRRQSHGAALNRNE
jgi:hypothetical protein